MGTQLPEDLGFWGSHDYPGDLGFSLGQICSEFGGPDVSRVCFGL